MFLLCLCGPFATWQRPFARLPVWVKLRKTQYEQMFSGYLIVRCVVSIAFGMEDDAQIVFNVFELSFS
jgi:hypothetical protein